MLGVVIGDQVVDVGEVGEAANEADEDELRRLKGDLRAGRRYPGNIGLVAEIPLSRTMMAGVQQLLL